MQITSLTVDAFRNLNDFKIDFNDSHSSSVLIGQNGTGKSNLIEALIDIFRTLDLNDLPTFGYSIHFKCKGSEISVQANAGNRPTIKIDGKKIGASTFSKRADEFLPDHIFTYYSGRNLRIEDLFNDHQRRFYRDLLNNNPEPIRRLFFCRNVHSQFVLLAFLIDQSQERQYLMKDLGIIGLESVLFVLKKPFWSKSKPNETMLAEGDERFWYARGVVKGFLQKVWNLALAPIADVERKEIDFRGRTESQERLYLYLSDQGQLNQLAKLVGDPAAFFKELESTYISDLIEEVRIRVRHKDVKGNITFGELSEGEQQRLTVLGLMKFTKENETLFLLDEPDTHLNPIWKLRYFDDIEKIISLAGQGKSQLILATHDPLMIGSLQKEQVRILVKDGEQVSVHQPDDDPQGMGFAGLLKSELFGLRSTVDNETLRRIDERNNLYAKEKRTKAEEKRLTQLSEELSELGFATDFRDPYLSLFIKKMAQHTKFQKPILTPKEQEEQDKIADDIITEILVELGE